MKSTQTSPIFMELTESQEASVSGGSTIVSSITVSQANEGKTKTSTSTVVSNSETDTKAEKELAEFEKEFFKLDFDW
jgi:hypothetical protein